MKFMDYNFISKTPLFKDCPDEDIQKMSEHLNFRAIKYKKKMSFSVRAVLLMIFVLYYREVFRLNIIIF
jgi:hypothetical protein